MSIKLADDLISGKIGRLAHGSKSFLVYILPPARLCPMASPSFYKGWVAAEGTEDWISIGAYFSGEADVLRGAQEQVALMSQGR